MGNNKISKKITLLRHTLPQEIWEDDTYKFDIIKARCKDTGINLLLNSSKVWNVWLKLIETTQDEVIPILVLVVKWNKPYIIMKYNTNLTCSPAMIYFADKQAVIMPLKDWLHLELKPQIVKSK